MSKKEQELIDLAHDRFQACVDSSRLVREEALDDLRFLGGEHWDEDLKQERKNAGSPCLVINKLPVYVNQTVNDARMNRPSIKVSGVDGDTDPKTAEVMTGVIRHIQYNSDAESAYDTAIDHAISCGFGFFRIYSKYVSDDSFDQEIVFDRIDNPFSVYIPFHLCKKADLSDMPYAFIRQDIKKDEYKKQYGDDVADWESCSTGDKKEWISNDTISIVEHFYTEYEDKTLYMLTDGSTTYALPDGEKPLKQRNVKVKRIKWCKLSPFKVLEERDWPGQWIPLVAVLGKETIDDKGDKHYQSLIRWAKDPSRLYDYYKSNEAEGVARSTKSPWIGAEGQFEGHTKEWKVAHRKNQAYLEYKPTTLNGQLVPAPSRINPPTVDPATINGGREANDDIKATTGMFDASLGARGNETSGRAIAERKSEGDTATFHFVDNQKRAIRHAGRIIVDLFPHYYDTKRVLRILGDDMKEKITQINAKFVDPVTNEERFFDFTIGKYDVVVDIGPSYATRRQETSEALMRFVNSYPDSAVAAGDIIAKNMDFPGADKLAERLNRMVPPDLLNDEERAQRGMQVTEVQSKLAEAQQMIQTLDKVIEKMSKDLEQAENKVKSKEYDANVRLQIAELQAQVKLLTDDSARAHDVGMEAMRHAHNQINKSSESEPNSENNNQMEMNHE